MTHATDPKYAYSMHFHASERSAVFIDGPNLHAASKALNIEIDYKRLLGLFRERCHLVRALYYTVDASDQEFSSLRPLIDWLDYNGFSTVTKPAKAAADANGRRGIRNDMDVALAVDALRLAEHVDHIIIFSGDGALTPLVAALRMRGRRVSVVSTLKAKPPMISDELRRQADQFVELADLEIHLARNERRLR